jgi:hypothetical protein
MKDSIRCYTFKIPNDWDKPKTDMPAGKYLLDLAAMFCAGTVFGMFCGMLGAVLHGWRPQ